MATYNMGEFIRQLRHERGVTQEQLCDGLCSVSTLSKIERGQHTPPGYLFKVLMERLGNYFGRYYSVFLDKHDFEIWNKMEEVNKAIVKNDISLANELLSACNSIDDFSYGFGLQFRLNCKISIDIMKAEQNRAKAGKAISDYQSDVDSKEWVNMALESLRITIPNFDESKISSYMLSYEELRAIVSLGVAYHYNKENDKIIQVLSAAAESLDRFCPDMRDKSRYYAIILVNLAEAFYEVKRYEDAINTCIKGWRLCTEYSRTVEIPIFMSFHGKSLIAQGDREKGRELLRYTYYVSLANASNGVSEDLKSYFEVVFGERIDNCNVYPPY